MKNIDPGNPNWQFLSMIRDYQSRLDFRPLKITDQVIHYRHCFTSVIYCFEIFVLVEFMWPLKQEALCFEI